MSIYLSHITHHGGICFLPRRFFIVTAESLPMWKHISVYVPACSAHIQPHTSIRPASQTHCWSAPDILLERVMEEENKSVFSLSLHCIRHPRYIMSEHFPLLSFPLFFPLSCFSWAMISGARNCWQKMKGVHMHVYKEHLCTVKECRRHLHLYYSLPLTPFRLTKELAHHTINQCGRLGEQHDNNTPLIPTRLIFISATIICSIAHAAEIQQCLVATLCGLILLGRGPHWLLYII